MGAGDLSFVFAVVATGASVAVLMAFGFIRRRDTMAWDTGARGGGVHTDLPTLTDPDIARRIASLVREPVEPAEQDAPGDREPVDDEADGGTPRDTEGRVARSRDWPVEDATLPDPAPVALLSLEDLAVALPEPDWAGMGAVAWTPAVPAAPAAPAARGTTEAPPAADGARTPAVLDPAVVPEPDVAPDREVLARLLVDPLTGLGTPLAWQMWIADEEPRVRRYRRPATVVLAELDGLDAVGAFHGPEVAEGAAAMIGAAFRANVRSCDRAAVVGPGLYAILLPETDEIRAVNFVERVRATCEEWLAINSPSVRLLLGWASPDADGLAGARVLAERRLERERH